MHYAFGFYARMHYECGFWMTVGSDHALYTLQLYETRTRMICETGQKRDIWTSMNHRSVRGVNFSDGSDTAWIYYARSENNVLTFLLSVHLVQCM